MLHNLINQHQALLMLIVDSLVKEATPTECFFPLFEPSSLSSPIPTSPAELGPATSSPSPDFDLNTDAEGGGIDIETGDVLFRFLSYSIGSEVTVPENDGYCTKGSEGMFGSRISRSVSPPSRFILCLPSQSGASVTRYGEDDIEDGVMGDL